MSGSESFTMAMQHQPQQQQQNPLPSQPSMPSMRLAYAPDGTAIYKPIASSPAPIPPSNPSPLFHPSNLSSNPPPSDSVSVHPGPGASFSANEPMMKKKRGRPRKYGPDGNMSLAIVPAGGDTSATPPGFQGAPAGAPGSGGRKSKGGRPPGSANKKKQLASLGSSGIGFTPHVITVKAGEDVSAKIMAFSQNGPRAICVLSANGAISNVTLRQAATSGGTVTYEGRFEILSLSGSFLMSENGGQRSRTGGLSVSLAGPDGRVLGGSVAGLLTAASPVQVVVGSFIAEGGKKEKKKQVIHQDPIISAPSKLGPIMQPIIQTGGSSSPSRGTMSESSGGPASPPNQSGGPFGSHNSQPSFANFPWK